jgi:hypothetical protein
MYFVIIFKIAKQIFYPNLILRNYLVKKKIFKKTIKIPIRLLDVQVHRYIKKHLSKFDKEGIASRIVKKDDYLEYGIGKTDVGKTEFVVPKSEINHILGLPLGEQATKLGIPVEQLQNMQITNEFPEAKLLEVFPKV